MNRQTGVEARARDALLVCIARFGLSKTTLDDVARVAGCSRATLYRYFDGKATLVRRTVDPVEKLLGKLRQLHARPDCWSNVHHHGKQYRHGADGGSSLRYRRIAGWSDSHIHRWHGLDLSHAYQLQPQRCAGEWKQLSGNHAYGIGGH
jgi:AcrR family transcriptional regulator